MREVIVICESIKKAKKHSTKILDKYFYRIGSNTWRGVASNQCLSVVGKELRKTASRGTSVTVHGFQKNQEQEVIFHVGNKNKFNKSFKRVIRNSKTKNDTNTNTSILAVLKFSAHFHDVGKMFNTFQKKMFEVVKTNVSNLSDPIRHEFISAIFWDELTKNIGGDIKNYFVNITTDDIDLAIKKTEDIVEKFYYKAINLSSESNSEYDFAFANDKGFVGAVGMIILTHHKLVSSNSNFSKFNVTNHINLNSEVFDDSFKMCVGTPFYKETGWIDTFKSDCEKIDNSFIYNGSSDIFIRTSLMIADHQAAKEGALAGIGRYVDGHIANTNKDDNGNVEVADDLKTHVKRVVNNTRKSYDSVIRNRNGYPSISYENIPDSIKYPTMYGRFGWQGKLSNTVKDIVENDCGLFGCVMAGTGTGKTRVAPSIFSAISHKTNTPMRYILCQPLRVLANQTCKEYCDDLSFSKYDVCAMMSKKPLSFEFESDEESGSENRLNEMDYIDVEYADNNIPEGIDNDWYKTLNFDPERTNPMFIDMYTKDGSSKSIKTRKILSTPIVTSTIDYIMGVASPIKSSHLSGAIRLISSDVVLDEVDLYSPEDISVVSRLAYYVGAAGRKLIVMSATITKTIATELYNSYVMGYADYCTTFGVENKIKKFTASNQDGSIFYDDNFSECYDKTKKVILAADKNDTTKIANVLQLSDDIRDIHSQINKEINILHDNNHEIIDGFEVSVGFVRMTRISHTVSFANQVHDNDNGVLKVYACIHSNMPRVVREFQEMKLKKYLTRKGDNPNKGIVDMCNDCGIFENAISKGVKKIQIILICSPVIETGNDIDFDWAVIDPSSTRSIIQASGRVNRHRNISKTKHNITILSRPMVTYDNNGKGLFQYPGIQTPPPSDTLVSGIFLNLKTKFDVVEMYGPIKNITSSLILDNNNIVPIKEEELIKKYIDGKFSTKKYTSNNIQRNSINHIKARKFRRNDIGNEIVWLDKETETFYNTKISKKLGNENFKMKKVLKGSSLINPLFKDISKHAYFSETGDKEYDAEKCEYVFSLNIQNNDPNFTNIEYVYDENIGFILSDKSDMFNPL